MLLALRASSGRGTWKSSRMHHLLESFLLDTGFGSTGTPAFGGTTTNTSGSMFGGGTTTGFGGGTSLIFALAWIMLLDSIPWSSPTLMFLLFDFAVFNSLIVPKHLHTSLQAIGEVMLLLTFEWPLSKS